MQKILKAYLRRLTNLTSRNKSLVLLNLSQSHFFDLHNLDFLNEKPSFNLIEQLIELKKQIKLCDVLDPRFERVNEMSNQLRRLARTEQMIEEERGANDLYVGYPFVKGMLLDGTVIRCPLLFFPVSLIQKNNQWLLEKREEPISFNRSFLLAYAHFNKITIADEWLDYSFEDFDKDSLNFRTQLYELLKTSPLEINFNQELFKNQLVHFQRVSKAELEQNERKGELKLQPEGVVGVFPQGGSFLVNDYQNLIEESVETDDFEDIFATEVDENTSLSEADTVLPFSVDESQESAIRLIKSGKSVVVQGPPGTGKSQLICNLIADFTARGKRVLMVCQKRVALDTVYKRLKGIGMEDFVGLVHDFKNDRKVLFEKISSQIEKIDAYKKQNQSLDAIVLERNFTQMSRRIDQLSQELQSFKDALYDVSLSGTSIKELYLTTHAQSKTIDVEQAYKQLKISDLSEVSGKLNQFFQYEKAISYNLPELIYEFWKQRISFHNFSFSEKKVIEQTLNALFDFCEKLPYQLTLTDFLGFDENVLRTLLQKLENQEVIDLFYRHKKPLMKDSELRKVESILEEIYETGIETTIESEWLSLRKVQFQKALEAQQSVVNKLVWQGFSKDKALVKELLQKNSLSLQIPDLQQIIKKIDNRIRFEEIAQRLSEHQIEIHHTESPTKTLNTIKNHILAFDAQKIVGENVFLRKIPIESAQNLKALLQEILDKTVETKQKVATWQSYLTTYQINQISGLINEESFNKELIISTLNKNFDLFFEQDSLRFNFGSIEKETVRKLLSAGWKDESAVSVFENSIRLAWIQHIENQYPILRGVSSLKIQQLEDELQSLIQKKEELSKEILLIRLREQTYKNLIINRLQNVVSYRELLHQVTKKRKVWSVRKVLETYAEEVFKLVPCWMASPESVSAIFDFKEKFDLVIFDEASQCYAEHGIPSMYRGKQVVVAGDKQQLQPNDLYQIRYENGEEEDPMLEIDSLLDLSSQYLLQTQLRGHYRSHSLDLIDFSNVHFYNNSLRLLPHYQAINQNKPAIQYVKVNGIWERNSNIEEAEKVVEILIDVQSKTPEKIIGVVTFNFQQAEVITELIDSKGLSRISVKNIENIQGDEFDIVIFSVAYAPDIKGRMLMNFGSLSQKGGENRLNVAVTRAKEMIYIVSSIFPNEIRTENLTNEGAKLLKKYLEYAWQVSQRNYEPQPLSTDDYKIDWLLKNKLEIREKDNEMEIMQEIPTDFYVRKELPFADLTIKDGTKYDSLILTDDDLYFTATSKEAHGYLPISLAQKGWKFKRVWSRNYFIRK